MAEQREEIRTGMLVTVKADGPNRGRVGRVVQRPWDAPTPQLEDHVYVAIYDDPVWGGGSRGVEPFPIEKLEPYNRDKGHGG